MASNKFENIPKQLEYLLQTKELIKQAIIAKGVEVNDEDTFRSYAEKIDVIFSPDMSKTDAGEEDILMGKIAFVGDSEVTGSMPNLGELEFTPSDEDQEISAGYTSGGTVLATDITQLNDYNTCLQISDEILNTTGEVT